MQSKATTVTQYLAELPADRRATIEAVRATIRANVDRDVEEGMQYGMIGYFIPHRVFPAGYHCDPRQPLPYIALASQKNACSLYLMGIYHAPEEQVVRDGFARAGKKLDMGKSCIRFKRVEDLELGVIAEVIRRVPSAEWIRRYSANLASRGTRPAGASASAPAAKAKPASAKPAKAKPATAKLAKAKSAQAKSPKAKIAKARSAKARASAKPARKR